MKIAQKNKKKKILVLTAVVFLILCTFIVYYYFITKSSKPYTTTHSGEKVISDPNVPGGTKKPDSSNKDVSGIGISREPATSVNPDKNITPKTPIGVFVSNHRPNLSGSPAPNTINSTCSTTPGVFCSITFTQGSSVKSLPEQQTDANGNIEWNWSLQQVGLTEGSWDITVTAKNGDLTSTTTDAIPLEVQR